MEFLYDNEMNYTLYTVEDMTEDVHVSSDDCYEEGKSGRRHLVK